MYRIDHNFVAEHYIMQPAGVTDMITSQCQLSLIADMHVRTGADRHASEEDVQQSVRTAYVPCRT